MTDRTSDCGRRILQLSRETQVSTAIVTAVAFLSPVLFGEPMSMPEIVSLILSATAAGLCVRENWTWIERATFPVVIAFPLHLLLSSTFVSFFGQP